MTLSQFIDKYTGKGIDFDGSYGNQCQDLYRQYVKEVLNLPQTPPVVGAKDNWTANTPDFDKIPNTPTGVPPVGSIMIWGAKYGPYGHVAIVTSATVTQFTCFSQNDPSGSLCGLKTYKTYGATLGWMVPKETMLADEIAVKKTDFEKLVAKSSSLDEILTKYNVADSQALYNFIAGIQARSTDLGNQLGALQATEKNMANEISTLTQKVIEQQTDLNTLSVRLTDSNDAAAQVSKERADLVVKLAQLQVQYDTLKQTMQQGGATLTIRDFFTMILNGKITLGGK